MMNLKKNRFMVILLIIVLILSVLALTSCNNLGRRSPNSNPENERFYQGYEGVNMKFTEGMPPNKLYFYGDSYDNTFDVNVELANIGSSFAFGGIFLSGYDPTMINVLGIIPDRSRGGACQIDVNNIGLGSFLGTLRCNNFFIGAGKDDFEIGIRDLFGTQGDYAGRFDANKLIGGLSLNTFFKKSGDQNNWNIDFTHPSLGNANIEYADHGRFLVAFFSNAIDFTRSFGLEYLLEGDTYEYPGGEIAYMNFDGEIVNWPPGLDYSRQTFMITNCNLYATYAAPIVCIDPAPYSQGKKVCTPRSYTGTKGQGAPVAVTHIEQENTPRQAIFTIHVKNVGRGQVYDFGNLEKCSPYYPGRVTNEDLNVIYIGDIRVSGDLQRLKCTPYDFVRLNPQTGEGIITCSYEIPFSGLKSAYQAPLVVELWYGYSTTMEKTVLIKRAI